MFRYPPRELEESTYFFYFKGSKNGGKTTVSLDIHQESCEEQSTAGRVGCRWNQEAHRRNQNKQPWNRKFILNQTCHSVPSPVGRK